VCGAVAGTYTQTGSSPTDRLRIVPTKGEELGQIYMPLFVGIVGSNLSGPTKPDSALSCEKKLIMSYIHENICHPFSVWGSIAGKKMDILVSEVILKCVVRPKTTECLKCEKTRTRALDEGRVTPNKSLRQYSS